MIIIDINWCKHYYLNIILVHVVQQRKPLAHMSCSRLMSYTPETLLFFVPLSLCPSLPWRSFFFFHLYSRAPLTERLRQIHMSHQLMEIPIVFSQRAPQRSWGCLRFSALLCVHKCKPTSFHTAPAHHTTHTLTCKDSYIVHLHFSSCSRHTPRCFLSEYHSVQIRTINKQYNMAHQEAPHRPGS